LVATTFEKGALEANLARHLAALRHAREASCELAVFPELSLTGSVDPVRHPEWTVGVDHDVVQQLAGATAEIGVAALFGVAERAGDDSFISQIHATGGRIDGVQRKRRLGEGEEGFTAAQGAVTFAAGGSRFATIICAEAPDDGLWDESASTGASVVCFCAAPGLYGRRTDDAGWRAGFEWWEGCGLGDARRQAARLGLWVAMVTQAGSTVDEDFPGIAALISPTGEVVDRLPDWRPGTLVVDIPDVA
jgi:predicted amidohydrolase